MLPVVLKLKDVRSIGDKAPVVLTAICKMTLLEEERMTAFRSGCKVVELAYTIGEAAAMLIV